MAQGFIVIAVPQDGLFVRDGKMFGGGGKEIVLGKMNIHSSHEEAEAHVADLVRFAKGTSREKNSHHMMVLEVEYRRVTPAKKGGAK